MDTPSARRNQGRHDPNENHPEQGAADAQRLRLKTWRGLAGTHLDEMLGSAERAKEYLSNEEPSLRIAALSILTQHFGLWTNVQSQCEAMATTDRDSTVRLSARISLAKCYQNQNDPRSKRVLAEIVKDESVADDVRLSCYVLFMGLNQVRLADWAGRFPDDVDWVLIDEAIRTHD